MSWQVGENRGGVPGASRLRLHRREVDAALEHGRPLWEVQARIDHLPLDHELRAALWLYARARARS